MPPTIPAPNPPIDGPDAACYLLANNALIPELVVASPVPSDGTLKSVAYKPPAGITAADLPICILSVHAADHGAQAAGVQGMKHKLMATIYVAEWTPDTNRGDLEVLARRYVVTVPQAINLHIRLSRTAGDPGSTYVVTPIRSKIGPAPYAGFAGEGVSNPNDAQQYMCYQLEIAALEKEVRPFAS